jgi:hypothetical protein
MDKPTHSSFVLAKSHTSNRPRALVAAGIIDAAKRRAIVATEWRDRYGRWVDMGRSVRFKFRLKDGTLVDSHGRFLGADRKRPGYARIYVKGDKYLPDGVYSVSSKNGAEELANLDPKYLAARGIRPGYHQNGSPITSRSYEDVPNIGDMTYTKPTKQDLQDIQDSVPLLDRPLQEGAKKAADLEKGDVIEHGKTARRGTITHVSNGAKGRKNLTIAWKDGSKDKTTIDPKQDVKVLKELPLDEPKPVEKPVSEGPKFVQIPVPKPIPPVTTPILPKTQPDVIGKSKTFDANLQPVNPGDKVKIRVRPEDGDPKDDVDVEATYLGLTTSDWSALPPDKDGLPVYSAYRIRGSKVVPDGDYLVRREAVNTTKPSEWGKSNYVDKDVLMLQAYDDISKFPVPQGSEAASLLHYTSAAGYKDINNLLRAHPDKTLDEIMQLPQLDKNEQNYTKMIRDLDNLIDRSEVKQDTTVYRGIALEDQAELDKMQKLLVPGATWDEQSFASTSEDQNVARIFAGTRGIVFKIVVPKGAKALPVLPQQTILSTDEHEMILPRNGRLIIKSVNHKATLFTDHLEVEAEYEPPREEPKVKELTIAKSSLPYSTATATDTQGVRDMTTTAESDKLAEAGHEPTAQDIENVTKAADQNLLMSLGNRSLSNLSKLGQWAYKYTSESKVLNQKLRKHDKATEQSREVDALDTLIRETKPLPQGSVVYRTVKSGVWRNWKLKPGDVVSDDAYVSTSIGTKLADSCKSVNKSKGKTVHETMRIIMPQDTSGIFLGKISDFEDENEYLLPRGTKLRYLGLDSDGYRVMERVSAQPSSESADTEKTREVYFNKANNKPQTPGVATIRLTPGEPVGDSYEPPVSGWDHVEYGYEKQNSKEAKQDIKDFLTRAKASGDELQFYVQNQNEMIEIEAKDMYSPGGIYGQNGKTLQRGNTYIHYDSSIDSKETLDELIKTVDYLHKNAQLPVGTHIMITPQGAKVMGTKFPDDVSGATFTQKLGKFIAITRPDGVHNDTTPRSLEDYDVEESSTHFAPSAMEVSALAYTMFHEWGHAFERQLLSEKEEDDVHQIGEFEHVSDYGTESGAEFFAEVFADCLISKMTGSYMNFKHVYDEFIKPHMH